MALNFSGIGKSKGVANVQRRLKPWDIYDVEFKGARVDEVKSTKNEGVVYQILKIRFENEDGYYEESIFFPKDGDEKRPTRKNKDGRDVEMASSLERTEAVIAQVSAVLNPTVFEKLQELATAGKFKDFETLSKFFIEKICKPVIGTKTKLKLIGKADKDGNIQPILPYFLSINRDGEARMTDNFLGEKVFFSPYEETKRKEFLEAKPTKVKKEKDSDFSTLAEPEAVQEDNLDQKTQDELDSFMEELD